jgi:eukaryotic-like serine/threonine-protein kinase
VPNTSAEIAPDPTAVASELERIAASPSFRKAERCVRLLRYLTGRALEGGGDGLKEYALGISVFDRPESFDPRTDPVVRLEARRLRLKLAEYYQNEGIDDVVVIELPKGAYVPHFRSRQAPPEPPSTPAQRPVLLWFATAAAVVSLAAATWYFVHRRGERSPVRASIAVLGFRDLSGSAETSWIDPAVSELMSIELASGQQLRTMPPENVARMRTELSVTPQSTYPAELLHRIGTNLGIDYAVAGAYQPQGGRVRLDVVLFDVRSGQQIAAVGDESDRDKLLQLAQDCAKRIRANLGIRLSSLPGVSAYPPLGLAGMESYARGMERLRQLDALGARPYLETAASAAPSNALVHAGLARAWSMLGLDRRAREEAKQAFDSSAGLGRVDQLEIEGQYREMDHDWPRAIQVYQALFTLLPDDLEYGLQLASAQAQGAKAQDALGTVGTLRHLPAPLRDDPRIDLAEARAAGSLSDFAHTRQAAHIAAEKASQQGARLQFARARLLESGAMQNLAVPGYAEVRAEARRICAELGDRACVAAAYRIEANNLAMGGAPAAARPLYAAVLQISNEIGNQLEKLNALMGLAYVEKIQGDVRAAEKDDREALAVASEMSPQKRHAVCLELAEVLAAEGRIADSRAFGQEALDGSEQSGEKETLGLSHAVLARGLSLEGKFPEAIGRYNEAVRILREVNDPVELGRTLLELGDTQLQQGNTADARKSFEEARDLDRKSAFARPEIEMAFARLSLSTGQAEDAAAPARDAMGTFAAEGREGDRLTAAAVLARALIARGAAGEAADVLNQIPPPDGRALPIAAVVEFRIARCLVVAKSGRRVEAGRSIDQIAAEVSRLGLFPLQTEARRAREEMMNDLSHASLSH